MLDKQMILIVKYTLVALICLAVTTNGYALQGTWLLRTSEISQLQGIRAPIPFQFSKEVSQKSEIQGTLVIKACRILTYSYSSRDDQLFIRFKAIGGSLRGCRPGQINYLRSTMDLIFYFYILDRMMLLLPPNGQLPIKLQKQKPVAQTLNGVWKLTDGVFFNKVTDPLVIINGAQMALCNGNSRFLVETSGLNKIKITKLISTDCNGLIVVLLSSSMLYRVNRGGKEAVLSFYDKDIRLVAEMSFEGQYALRKRISFEGIVAREGIRESRVSSPFEDIFNMFQSNFGGSTSSNQNVLTANVRKNISQSNAESKPQINGPVKSPTTVTGSSNSGSRGPVTHPIRSISTISTSANPLTKTILQATTTPRTSTNPNSTTNNKINSPSAAISTPTTTNTAIQAQEPSITSTPPSITSTPPSITPPKTTPAPTLPNSLVLAQIVSDIQGIWYPYQTASISSLATFDPKAFQIYQIIINRARILISGGCNNIFSTYKFSKGIFSDFKKVSSRKSCIINNDSVLQNILMSNNSYYVETMSNYKFIEVRSPNGTVLLRLIDLAPQI